MTSLLTNPGAMTALQTLRMTNMNLMKTQDRISTGLRVKTAADNAAYWAIATTMRSDNMALDAVKDAIGLAKGTIDTMATALDKGIEVMKKIKEKLVAASDEGVDRQKVQDEITQLQQQLRSTATSAVYNEQNWLSVNSATDPTFNGDKSLVSSFNRINDAVTVESITYNISGVVLFDGDNGGILGGVATGPGGVNAEGLTRAQFDAVKELKEFIAERFTGASGNNQNTAANISAALGLTGAAALTDANLTALNGFNTDGNFARQNGGAAATNQQQIANLVQASGQIALAGTPTTTAFDQAVNANNLTFDAYQQIKTVFDQVARLTDESGTNAVTDAQLAAILNTDELGAAALTGGAAIAAADIAALRTAFGGIAVGAAAPAWSASTTGTALNAAAEKAANRLTDIYTNGVFGGGSPATGANFITGANATDNITLAAGVGGVTEFDLGDAANANAVAGAQTLQDAVDSIATAREAAETAYAPAQALQFVDGLRAAFAAGGSAADSAKSEAVDIDATPAFFDESKNWTPASFTQSSDENKSIAGTNAFSIAALGNTVADKQTLADYTQLVQDGLDQMIAGSSTIGSIKTRLDGQLDFVKSLQDAISRGVGQLVDADMDAESARLKALQVQQQLGIQALSIANNQGQNLLTLFR